MTATANACDDNEPHWHHTHGIITVLFRGRVLFIAGNPVALVADDHTLIGDRLVELLTRYGYADVPDTPPPAWPAPDLRTWHGRTLENP